MTPQAKKAAEEILRAVDSRPIYEEEAADIIDRAFADVLRERDELREALRRILSEWDYQMKLGNIPEDRVEVEQARALLEKTAKP